MSFATILELRRYQLHPGRRDDLIRLFDREFVESQESVGAQLIGQFRDLADPNQFVWLRGFADMASRAAALGGFYGGPVWQAHRAAANETMVDSSNVLLLHPAGIGHGFTEAMAPRPAIDAGRTAASLVAATIYRLRAPAEAGFAQFFEKRMAPALAEAGMPPIAAYQTLAAENNFPALPVRTDAPVFVSFARFSDRLAGLAGNGRPHMVAGLTDWLIEPPTGLRLAPTARSRLR
jgi:hypothetical protein